MYRKHWCFFLALSLSLFLCLACGSNEEPTAEAQNTEAEAAGEVNGLSLDNPDEIKSLIDDIGGAIPYDRLQEVVFRVNGEPVYAWQVFDATRENLVRVRAQGADLTEDQEMQVRAAMAQLVVMNEVVFQEAKKQGVEVSEAQVDEALANAKNQMGGTERFNAMLELTGLSEDEWRMKLERQLVTEAFRSQMAEGIEIDEAMLRKHYEDNPELFLEGEEVDASFILVKVNMDDPEAKVADARARIEEAQKAIQDGMSFADAARQYSQADNAAKGGALGFFGRGNMVPAFEKAAFGLKVGEVSDIIRTNFGFNLITVHDRKEPTRRSFEEVKPELMLEVSQKERSRIIQDKMEALAAGAEIEMVNEELLQYRRPQTEEASNS